MRKGITLSEAKTYLRIDRDKLDEAIMEQPMLFHEVSAMLVVAKEAKDMAKLERDRVEAETAKDVRRDFVKNKTKYTEGTLREEIALDPDCSAAQDEYTKALSEVTAWEFMKEAFSQRSFMLRELAHLWSANYFGENSLQGSGDATAITAESNRRKLVKDREERRSKRKRKRVSVKD